MPAPRKPSNRFGWTIDRRTLKDAGLFLERSLWEPLERLRGMFHVLPPLAALVIAFLFAFDGQIHEIYLSYLEKLRSDTAQAVAGIVFAIIGLTLLSALLFRAQYWLTASRTFVILSDHANPEAEAMGPRLQRTTAVALALAPWMGVAAGLVSVRFYLDTMYERFGRIADSHPPDMTRYLPQPSGWLIAIMALILGAANAVFIRRQENALRHVIVATTPAAAFCMFFLVTDHFQLPGDLPRIAIGSGAIVLLSAAYYLVYRRLHARGGFVPISRARGLFVQKHHQALVRIWLLLPWALIALYFIVAATGIVEPKQNRWSALAIGMSATIIGGLFIVQILDDIHEASPAQPAIILSIATLAGAAWLFPVFFSAARVVRVYRLIGPLGTTSLALVFLLAILVLLAWLSHRSRLPALTLVALAIVGIALAPGPTGLSVAVILLICLIVGISATLARLYPAAGAAAVLAIVALVMWREADLVEPVKLHPQGVPNDALYADASGTNVCQRFERWLQQKSWAGPQPSAASSTACPGPSPQQNGATPGHHVAYLIAVEGGGIYAGSAASLFLGKLQDAASNFSDHVFAISGVSGGAIGTAVFGALDAQPTAAEAASGPRTPSNLAPGEAGSGPQTPSNLAPADAKCALGLDWLRANGLCAKASKVFEDDHYSPVIGSIFPELFGASTGRADMLAQSFAQSVAEQDPDAGAAMLAPYVGYWSEAKHLPALLLNTTWAENGVRVAFAPFPLHDIDESLFSFADRDMPPLDGAVATAPTDVQGSTVSLIKAAVVSARFPGMLPPFSLVVDPSDPAQAPLPKRLRWNFVDGGYSDSSGAATALALYQALAGIAEQHDVELQVILVTSAAPQPDIAGTSGTAFRDTLAPVDAILKVRQGASNAAVARACNQFYPHLKFPCEDHAGEPGANLQVLQIEDTTYGLALGWEISHTTFDIIAWSLGNYDPNACGSYATRLKERRSEIRNSCVFTSIVNSLTKELPTSH